MKMFDQSGAKKMDQKYHRVISLVSSSSSRYQMKSTASRLIGFDKPTVWAEFTPLAIANKAINLGQGFPDWESPKFCKDAIIRAVTENHNQYCRSAGEMNLVQSISKHYSPYFNRTIDPLTEIATSVGATECMFAINQAYIQEGDEVLMLEPGNTKPHSI